MKRKEVVKQVRTCPICGSRFADRSLYGHLTGYNHDIEELAWYIAKLARERWNSEQKRRLRLQWAEIIDREMAAESVATKEKP